MSYSEEFMRIWEDKIAMGLPETKKETYEIAADAIREFNNLSKFVIEEMDRTHKQIRSDRENLSFLLEEAAQVFSNENAEKENKDIILIYIQFLECEDQLKHILEEFLRRNI